MTRRPPYQTKRPTVRRQTGTQLLNEATARREAAIASGVSEDDYLDGIAADALGITVEEFRAAASKIAK